MDNIKEALKPEVKDALSEDSQKKIEQLFNEKVDKKVEERVALQLEKALNDQDEEYSVALEKFLNALDTDHSNKLKKVVESIETNHTQKLKRVVSKYEKALTTEAADFKSEIVGNLSKYLDLYVDQAIPQAAVMEAVENKNAAKILNSIRKTLGVDLALAKESVKDAILDGKQQSDEARKGLEDLKAKVAVLATENADLKAKLFVEQKTAELPDNKKKYIKKVLSGKSIDFIQENFDYTVSMFDKKENENLKVLTEQAKDQTSKADRIVEESTKTQQAEKQPVNPYLAELQKY